MCECQPLLGHVCSCHQRERERTYEACRQLLAWMAPSDSPALVVPVEVVP